MRDELLAIIRASLMDEGLDAAVIHRVDGRVREQAGGCRWYVPKRNGHETVGDLARLIAIGVAPREAMRQLGIPKSTGYAMLNRRWSPRR